MYGIYKKILSMGVLTERLAKRKTAKKSDTLTGKPALPGESEVDELGTQLKAKIDRRFAGSLHIRQVDAGSCNGCELEIHALNNVYYDIERFGIHFVASPRHADLLLVTGPVSRNMETALLRTYEATPNPKWVIAVGDCGACGGEFGISYASCGAVANVIPVDAVVAGCPPTPVDLMRGILGLLGRY